MIASKHGALLTAAARAALRAIGCIQKGRSRTWLDDHGWWVGVIEFQPSGWSRGSYLNVGACWLWAENKFLSLDAGYRVEGFREFHDAEEFSRSAEFLAQRAKEETLKLRARFPNIHAVAAHLRHTRTHDNDIWGHYHAGVSAGLVEWHEEARRRSQAAMDVEETDAGWVRDLQRRCSWLLSCMTSDESFRAAVEESVIRARAGLKLPSLKEGSHLEF